MAQLTSQLVVKLIDLVSGPARGVAASLRGIGSAARSLNGVSMAGVARQIAADGKRVRSAVGAVGTSISGVAGGLGLYKLHHDVYEFAKATNKLASANPDVAAEQIERIKALSREVSRTSLFDPATVMNAANALARADVSMAAIEGSLKPLANAAMAADVPVSQLADDFVKLASGFGLAYKTREQAQETFSYLADLAQYVSQKAPGQFDDFVQGMKQVAPSVRSLGVSIEWLAGAYIMLDKAGIRNEEAGTAIKSMFKSIVQPTASARGMMAQLGIDPSELTKRAAGVKSGQLVKRLAAEYGKDFSQIGPELQRILESGGTTVDMQKALVGAIESQWGKMKPQDARKLVKTVGNFLASGVSAIDPQAWLDALAKRGVTFGQFLQMVEPRQAQRLSNLAQQAGEAGDQARKALETPLTQMLDFKRGLADQAAAKMMGGYVGAIQKLSTAWTSFIETLDTSGVIDRIASALTSLGTALANVFKGDASLRDWGVALAAAVPLIAPLVTAVAGLAFAFKGLTAAISLAGAALIKLPLAGLAGAIGALGGGAAAAAGAAVGGATTVGAAGGGALATGAAAGLGGGGLAAALGLALVPIGALGALHEATREYAGMTLGERLRAKRGGRSTGEAIRDRFDERDRLAAEKEWESHPPPYAAPKPWPDQSGEAAQAGERAAKAFSDSLTQWLTTFAWPKTAIPDQSRDAAAAGERTSKAFIESLTQGLSGIEWPKTTIPDHSNDAAAAGAHTAQSFGDRLLSELRRVEAEVRASVARMVQALSFSASPSITPKIAPAPAGSAMPMRGTAPAAGPTPTRTAARGLYADYDNGGDLDWV